MKGKRVLTLLLAAAVTVSNGNIVLAAEGSSTEHTETMGMEEVADESVGQVLEKEPAQDVEAETDAEEQDKSEV